MIGSGDLTEAASHCRPSSASAALGCFPIWKTLLPESGLTRGIIPPEEPSAEPLAEPIEWQHPWCLAVTGWRATDEKHGESSSWFQTEHFIVSVQTRTSTAADGSSHSRGIQHLQEDRKSQRQSQTQAAQTQFVLNCKTLSLITDQLCNIGHIHLIFEL